MLMYSNTPAFVSDSTTGFAFKNFANAVATTIRAATDVSMILITTSFIFFVNCKLKYAAIHLQVVTKK